MAQSYNRRINLFINIDGKEVQNNVKSIRGEMSKLINEQNKMTIGSQEYNTATQKIKYLNGILAQHRTGLKEVETPMQKLIGTAKNLLPAFGFAALGGLAQQAFSKIISATDTLGTKWDIFMGGVTGATNELWRTIATGDWSNLTTNMGEAIRVGREYEKMLDSIEEKTRSLRVQEAESRSEELRLEDMLRNKTLSKAERIKAGQARIALDENLSKQRVKVAQNAFDAEMAVTMQQTRLSKERLMEVVKDMDSETKAKAQAYNEQLEILESAKKKNDQVQAGLSRGGVTTNPFADQMNKAKAVLDSYPDSVKQYAEALRGVGSTTDAQLNKMVSAYEGLLTAQNSAMENTRRVRTQVNTLLADEKRTETETKTDVNAPHIDPFVTESDNPLEYEEWMKRMVDADTLAFAEKKRSQEEWTAFLDKKVQEQIDIKNRELEHDKEIAAAQQELKAVRIDAIGQIAGALSDMFEQGSAAQIAFLAIEKAAAIAQIIFQTGIANAKAVAASPLTFGQPWVSINTISAGASIAGIVAQTIGQVTLKKKEPKGYETGGFTNGDRIYRAGEEGKEWIAPNWMLQNPITASIINGLEDWRNNPVTVSPGAIQASRAFAETRSYSNRSSSAPASASFSATNTIDSDFKEALSENTKAINKLMKWKPTIYTELVKKDFDTLGEIEKSRGL